MEYFYVPILNRFYLHPAELLLNSQAFVIMRQKCMILKTMLGITSCNSREASVIVITVHIVILL